MKKKQLEDQLANVVARIDDKFKFLTEAETESAPRKRTLSDTSRELPSQETSSSLSPDVIVSASNVSVI